MFDPIALPDDTLALRELVDQIVDKYQMPLEERILKGEVLSWRDYEPGVAAAREAGLWSLGLPESVGGAEISTFDRVAIEERTCRSIAQLRFGGNLIPGLLEGSDVQRERYVEPLLNGTKRSCFAQTEPGGGADPGGAIRTTAVRTEGGWKINGTKVWITGVEAADIVFVVALTDKEKRQKGGISIFAVEKDNPGLIISRKLEVLGGRITHELIFDDCIVDEHSMVGGTGTGFKSAQKLLSTARLNVGAQSLGVAERACEMMTAYAKDREVFGSTLAQKQAVQSFIVDSWLEIHQARLAMYNAAKRADEGCDIRVEAAMVKMLGTEVCAKVLDRAVQVYGAAGVTLDHPLAHYYAWQRASRIFEGPTETHKYHVIAKKLLAH